MRYNIDMSKTTLNLRVDADLKKEAEKVIEKLGLSTTACITLFLKALCRERKLPFAISAETKTKKQRVTHSIVKKDPQPAFNDKESKSSDSLSLEKAIDLL